MPITAEKISLVIGWVSFIGLILIAVIWIGIGIQNKIAKLHAWRQQRKERLKR